jgi:hypothetical protein
MQYSKRHIQHYSVLGGFMSLLQFLPVALQSLGILGNASSGTKKTDPVTVKQEPLITDLEMDNLKKLAKYAQTGDLPSGLDLNWGAGGKYPGTFKLPSAGKAYTDPLGSYDMTDPEAAGQKSLRNLISGGIPEIMGIGQEELKKLFNTDTYDPRKDELYKNFKKGILAETEEEKNAYKRDSAAFGNLYSTNTMNKLGEIEQAGRGLLADKITELTDKFVTNKLNAIPIALNAGQMEEDVNTGRISLSQMYGSLQRELEDAHAKDKLAEWTRTHGETLTDEERESGFKYGDWTRSREEIGDWTTTQMNSQLGALAQAGLAKIPWGSKEITLPGQEYQESGGIWDILGAGGNLLQDYLNSSEMKKILKNLPAAGNA